MAVYDTALPPALDLNYFCRTTESEQATSPTEVRPGDTVQFGLTLHNPRDWESNAIAHGVRVGFTFTSTGGGKVIVTTAYWVSDDANLEKDGPFRIEDTEVLLAETPVQVAGLRNVQLQRNLIEPTNDPTVNWGELEDVPEDRVGPFEEGGFSVQPNESGELKPCYSAALRVFFLGEVVADDQA